MNLFYLIKKNLGKPKDLPRFFKLFISNFDYNLLATIKVVSAKRVE